MSASGHVLVHSQRRRALKVFGNVRPSESLYSESFSAYYETISGCSDAKRVKIQAAALCVIDGSKQITIVFENKDVSFLSANYQAIEAQGNLRLRPVSTYRSHRTHTKPGMTNVAGGKLLARENR